jgi:uncharacterized protein YbbK (DUF523 family)
MPIFSAFEAKTPANPPIRIGISACLLGQNVRFDGSHKRSDYLVDLFGPFVEFVAVCPEVEAGLARSPRSNAV